MKRIGLLLSVGALAVMTMGMLAGCGANLDREVTVQGMIIEVPGNWVEGLGDDNDELRGTYDFVDEDEDLDEDETGNSITISYEKLTNKNRPSVAMEKAGTPMQSEAAVALAQRRGALEREYGVSAWSIDEEKSRVIDGAQVTTYEYSFVKDIEGVRRTYEYDIVYVVTPDMMYEILIVGDKVNAGALVDTIEF